MMAAASCTNAGTPRPAAVAWPPGADNPASGLMDAVSVAWFAVIRNPDCIASCVPRSDAMSADMCTGSCAASPPAAATAAASLAPPSAATEARARSSAAAASASSIVTWLSSSPGRWRLTTCVQMFCTSLRVTGLTRKSSAPEEMHCEMHSWPWLADIMTTGRLRSSACERTKRSRSRPLWLGMTKSVSTSWKVPGPALASTRIASVPLCATVTLYLHLRSRLLTTT
mmetsp:Transcript_40527/g.120918  ORF Transcript_40527/g.120918 Transcript_40527/m.120918 type:complete len:227 (+) Transcript_40527:211-891(+)